MIAFDCDDEDQFSELSDAVTHLRLDCENMLQSFAPDNQLEAKNRGFKPMTGT